MHIEKLLSFCCLAQHMHYIYSLGALSSSSQAKHNTLDCKKALFHKQSIYAYREVTLFLLFGATYALYMFGALSSTSLAKHNTLNCKKTLFHKESTGAI